MTLAEQIAAVKRLIDFMWPDNPHSPNLAAMRAVLATLEALPAPQENTLDDGASGGGE